MGLGYVEEGGDVLQRKEGEKVGMARYEFLIALLRRFGMQVDITVVDG